VIIDLDRFIERERPMWDELEYVLDRLELPSGRKRLDLAQAKRLHYLYERAAAGLARIQTFSSDPEVREHLESLVARAYALIHSTGRERKRRFNPFEWFVGTFPRTFRRHWRAFALSSAILAAGAVFGAAAVWFDPDSRHVLMPWGHADMRPSERVAQEEAGAGAGKEMKTAFSTMLMTNNIKVSILAMTLGATWAVGTMVLLFHNGAILGAVMLDYIRDGQSEFLAAWLLPHGSVEIPAILIAGQAGLVLGAALIGRGDRKPLKVRLREILPSLVTLIFGVAVLLVWAGILEAFLSQYHAPVVPYSLKIAFGSVQLVLLAAFLALSGRRGARRKELAA